MRDDFSQNTKDVLFKRARARCSNPECRRETCEAHSEEDKAVNIGFAAHITAASPEGPRYEIRLLSDESIKVRNLFPDWQVFGALVNLGEPTADEFNYRQDVRIWKQSHLQALLRAKEYRHIAQFLWTLPWHWNRASENLWWSSYSAYHKDMF